ncbi:hypothetical protein VKT23_008300 [Stygiomarasmius scandens]|uniref:Uncharacterized protein n=1 Tax=Marasmiellus scandens TaxID=2682957 RepID=A0ABR1JMG9_9AGAR
MQTHSGPARNPSLSPLPPSLSLSGTSRGNPSIPNTSVSASSFASGSVPTSNSVSTSSVLLGVPSTSTSSRTSMAPRPNSNGTSGLGLTLSIPNSTTPEVHHRYSQTQTQPQTLVDQRRRRERRYTEQEARLVVLDNEKDVVQNQSHDLGLKLEALRKALDMLDKSRFESLERLEGIKVRKRSGALVSSSVQGDGIADVDPEDYEAALKQRWMEERRLEWIEEMRNRVTKEVGILEGLSGSSPSSPFGTARKGGKRPGVASSGSKSKTGSGISPIQPRGQVVATATISPREERINRNLALFLSKSPSTFSPHTSALLTSPRSLRTRPRGSTVDFETKTPASPTKTSSTYRSSVVPIGRHSREHSLQHIQQETRRIRSSSSHDLLSSIDTGSSSDASDETSSTQSRNHNQNRTLHTVSPLKLRAKKEEEMLGVVVEGLKSWRLQSQSQSQSQSGSVSKRISTTSTTTAFTSASTNSGSDSNSPSSATASLDLETPTTSVFKFPGRVLDVIQDVDGEGTEVDKEKEKYLSGLDLEERVQGNPEQGMFSPPSPASTISSTFGGGKVVLGTATIYRRLAASTVSLSDLDLPPKEKLDSDMEELGFLPEYAKELIGLLDGSFSSDLFSGLGVAEKDKGEDDDEERERGRSRGRSKARTSKLLSRIGSVSDVRKSKVVPVITSAPLPSLPPILSTPCSLSFPQDKSESRSPSPRQEGMLRPASTSTSTPKPKSAPASRPRSTSRATSKSRSRSRSPSPAPRPVSPLQLLKPKPGLEFDFDFASDGEAGGDGIGEFGSLSQGSSANLKGRPYSTIAAFSTMPTTTAAATTRTRSSQLLTVPMVDDKDRLAVPSASTSRSASRSRSGSLVSITEEKQTPVQSSSDNNLLTPPSLSVPSSPNRNHNSTQKRSLSRLSRISQMSWTMSGTPSKRSLRGLSHVFGFSDTSASVSGSSADEEGYSSSVSVPGLQSVGTRQTEGGAGVDADAERESSDPSQSTRKSRSRSPAVLRKTASMMAIPQKLKRKLSRRIFPGMERRERE